MIVDTSAVLAILLKEPERPDFARLLLSEVTTMSAASYVEASVVIDRRREPRLAPQFDELLRTTETRIADLTRAQADIARQAHRNFGPGSGSPARLNMGDCFSYALAKDTDEPLLFKGDDFTHTDIRGYPTSNG